MILVEVTNFSDKVLIAKRRRSCSLLLIGDLTFQAGLKSKFYSDHQRRRAKKDRNTAWTAKR